MSELRKVADSIAYWWDHFVYGKTIITEIDDRIDIQLLNDEGEDHYVGSYADPGISMWEVGTVTDDRGEEHYLVRVNGIVMSGLGRSIVGWAFGLE